MFIPQTSISDDFRFPSKEVIWGNDKDQLKWVFSLRTRSFLCLNDGDLVTEIKLKALTTSKSMNNALLFIYKHSGRLPMARLAKSMSKACKTFGVEDFQEFLALNDDSLTPWTTALDDE